MEASLMTIADAFHTIGQEYEKLVGVGPHMRKTQAANVITRMPILPFVKQEIKAEGKQAPDQPLPGTSQDKGAVMSNQQRFQHRWRHWRRKSLKKRKKSLKQR